MKVEFRGTNKLIVVNTGITELDVQVDLYSDFKEWLKTDDNAKYKPAIRTVGGDPTTGIKSVAPYFFLTNGWKIRPQEGDHTLTISGNLFVDEPGTYGYNLTIPTIGDYTVTVVLSTTSDAIVISAGGAGGWDTMVNEYQEAGSFGKLMVDTKIGVDKLKKILSAGQRLEDDNG